jgi:hypothetical protein
MLLGLFFSTALLAANPSACAGADPAIVMVAVAATTQQGPLNLYHLSGTVVNLGNRKQASNVLQFVDIFIDGQKADARGIPPLAPGQRYHFGYDFKRSTDSAARSTRFRFQLDFRQPSPPGAQDCNPNNDTFLLRV